MHAQGNGSREEGPALCGPHHTGQWKGTSCVPRGGPGHTARALRVQRCVSGTGGPGHTACALCVQHCVSGILAFVYRGQGTERHTLTSLGKLSHSSCLLGKGTLGERQLPPCGWYGDRRNLVPKETWRSCSANAGAGQTGPQLVTKLSAPEEASYLQKPRPAPHRPFLYLTFSGKGSCRGHTS